MSAQEEPHGATPREIQIIEASRQLAGSQVVVIGSGTALAVAPLAKRTVAKDARFVLDSGAIDLRLESALVSVADPRMPECLLGASMSAVFFDLLSAGRVDTSVMSAAQIDATGNLNSSYLGDAAAPTKRFPGAGGAPAMVAGSRKVIVIVPHEERRFPASVDYITCPGPRTGRGHLQELVVVTDLCVMRCTHDRPELRVAALMPGAVFIDIQRRTSFALAGAESGSAIPTVASPTQHELRLLRDDVDPAAHFRNQ